MKPIHVTTPLVTGLLLALALALPATAQDRPMGSGGSGGSGAQARDPREALGDCPTGLLRQAWSENPALEVAAVEKEIVEFCTERVERIESLVTWQRRYYEELGILDAASQTAAQQIEPQPGTMVAETEPDRAESTGQTGSEPKGPAQDPETIPVAEVPPVEQNTAPEPASATPAPDAPGQPAASLIAPPAAAAQPTPYSGSAAQGELPPDRPTQWQVIHAVRAGEGAWDVLFHGTREIAISVPGATPEDPPVIRWQTITEPPATRTVGEALPDGLVLRAVTAEGVTLADPIAPEAEPLLIPFTPDPTPGVLEWQVIDLSTATGDGS